MIPEKIKEYIYLDEDFTNNNSKIQYFSNMINKKNIFDLPILLLFYQKQYKLFAYYHPPKSNKIDMYHFSEKVFENWYHKKTSHLLLPDGNIIDSKKVYQYKSDFLSIKLSKPKLLLVPKKSEINLKQKNIPTVIIIDQFESFLNDDISKKENNINPIFNFERIINIVTSLEWKIVLIDCNPLEKINKYLGKIKQSFTNIFDKKYSYNCNNNNKKELYKQIINDFNFKTKKSRIITLTATNNIKPSTKNYTINDEGSTDNNLGQILVQEIKESKKNKYDMYLNLINLIIQIKNIKIP